MVHHRRGLRQLLNDDELLIQIEENWREALLSPSRTAMLEYSVKLTLVPGEMKRSDVEALQSAGFSDRDVLDIVEVTSYYAYVNRIADGLGVPDESWIQD